MLELRYYQRDAVNGIYNYFQSGKTGNPLCVIPTAGGKSLILGTLIKEAFAAWPNQRMLMLSHVKELLQQNLQELVGIWPEAPVGVYSAGLGIRQLGRKVTIAGIASVYKRATEVGWIDLILIDECHLVNSTDEGMYRKLIVDLKKFNPKLKVVGFTATPFRLKSGLLIEPGGLFTDIAYEISVSELVDKGFLSPLISKIPKTQADLTNVTVRGGEFVQAEMEKAMDDDSLTEAAITEMETYLSDRSSIMVFCAGVDHAHHVKDALLNRGHTAEIVVGDTEDMFRAATVKKFKERGIKFLVNVGVFTTGFNAKNVDGIALLRGTKSVGLYIQICGRGMRLSPETEKVNCIVLDFGGNIERHGPIDDIKVTRKRASGDGEGGVAPVKTCPECRTAVAISVRECACGYEFPIQIIKHDPKASTKEIMSTTIKKPSRWFVLSQNYEENVSKKGGLDTLKVSYVVDNGLDGETESEQKRFSEWWCFNHRGFAREKAWNWWRSAHKDHDNIDIIEVPMNVAEAVREAGNLRPCTEIWVQPDGKYDRIISRTFGKHTEPETEIDDDDIPF